MFCLFDISLVFYCLSDTFVYLSLERVELSRGKRTFCSGLGQILNINLILLEVKTTEALRPQAALCFLQRNLSAPWHPWSTGITLHTSARVLSCRVTGLCLVWMGTEVPIWFSLGKCPCCIANRIVPYSALVYPLASLFSLSGIGVKKKNQSKTPL